MEALLASIPYLRFHGLELLEFGSALASDVGDVQGEAVSHLEPGTNDVVAEGLVDPTAARLARDQFAAAGRADLPGGVEITTANGEALLEGSFDYLQQGR